VAKVGPGGPLWYRRYRGTAYLNAVGALVWTVIIVLPFAPFSSLPPIIVGGGPGIWFILAYVLFMVVGIGGVGAFSAFLTTIELHEGRTLDPRTMWPGLILLSVGTASTCLLMGLAGAVGGYASTSGSSSASAVDSLLSPYVYPISTLALITVLGAALAVLSMVRARWPGS